MLCLQLAMRAVLVSHGSPAKASEPWLRWPLWAFDQRQWGLLLHVDQCTSSGQASDQANPLSPLHVSHSGSFRLLALIRSQSSNEQDPDLPGLNCSTVCCSMHSMARNQFCQRYLRRPGAISHHYWRPIGSWQATFQDSIVILNLSGTPESLIFPESDAGASFKIARFQLS